VSPACRRSFHIACKIIFGFAMIRHFTSGVFSVGLSSRRVIGPLKGRGRHH
jgi:hypothetical protein